MATSQKIWLPFTTRSKEQTESIWGSERPQPFWRCVSMMVRKFLSRPSESIIFRAINPGHWRQDPISLIPLALGAHWGECIPFVVSSTSQFRAPPPPDMTSSAYTAAYNEVKNLGGAEVDDAAHGRANVHRHLSGRMMARQACARLRDSTIRSRCKLPTRED